MPVPSETIEEIEIEMIELASQPNSISAIIEHDIKNALSALTQESYFAPQNDDHGPYSINLSIQENRLVFEIKNAKQEQLPMLVLSLKPYKRLLQDYFLILHSYDEAMKDGKPSRIEAIDMGRRGLHNEGASLLMERLEDKIIMDMDTARRLFTLICVLQDSKAMKWR